MSCVLSTLGLVAIIINSLIVVRYGRRRVLLTTGLIICCILQLIIAIVYDQKGRQLNYWQSFGCTFVPLHDELQCRTKFLVEDFLLTNLGYDCHLRLARWR